MTSVFPYLVCYTFAYWEYITNSYKPEMIESFNIPKDQVAKWAGITSAVFSLSQAVTGIFWGRASDRFGRKPVILVGMVCVMLASIFFGFSHSLAWAIVARSLAGAVNGNVGIIRTTVAEMVPQKELQPKAFSVMPLVWTIGSIFGPGFGGALADPAQKYPQLFGRSEFLKKYPFALPNLASSLFFLIGLVVGFLFLKETLETRKHHRDHGRILGKLMIRQFVKKKSPARWRHESEQSAGLLSHSHSSTSTLADGISDLAQDRVIRQAPPRYSEIFSKQSSINLLAYTLLALHSVAYDQLLPVFMHYPSQVNDPSHPQVRLPFKFAGGFGIDSKQIGFLFTLYGICGMFIQFLIFPPVARWYGVLPCFKVVTILFPIVYVATPFTALMPTTMGQQVAMFTVMVFKSFAVVFAFPCSTILLTNSAVSLRVLGTLNGVSTSVSALGRAAGPAIGGWTYSVGIDKGFVITPWWTLAAFAVLGALPVWWLVETDGFGDVKDHDSEVEEDELQASGDDDTGLPLPIVNGYNAAESYATKGDYLAPLDETAELSNIVNHRSGRAQDLR